MLIIAGGVLIGGSVLGMLGFGLVATIREFQKPRANRTAQGAIGLVSLAVGLWAAFMVVIFGLS